MHRLTILLAAALSLSAASAFAQSGATLTPDGLAFLVNKDIGDERWTIALNLSSADPGSFNNVTGNVFKRDGSPPSFVLCQVRLDSTGNLRDPGSTFRLQCSGTSACQTTAKECAREDWVPIGGDIQIPADFFLPPDGLGAVGQLAAAARGRDGDVATRLAARLEQLRGWLRDVLGRAISGPDAAQAQGNDRGSTLTLDGFNYLVNKDLGGLRWSISLNYVPERSNAGTIERRLRSVTGNVFDPNGQPSFIYCAERGDSTGTLEDPSSSFRLSCVGTDACPSDAANCATSQWREIPGGDDVAVPASFFLPPEGLPATAQSDLDIFVIGRTSFPPAIVTSDFTTPGGGASFSSVAGTSCPTGAACLARMVGTCEDVEGSVVSEPSFGCGCLVDPVPNGCISCGLQCGGSCDYPVGGSTARGTCLPTDSMSAECACFAIGAGSDTPIEACGGTLGVTCSGDRCCADDPSDGCDPARGDLSCLGVCVAADGCDPNVEECGICRPPQIPGGGGPQPTPRPTPGTGAVCGNGTIEPGEQCDGDDIGGVDCSDFDLAGGDEVRCTENCRYDTSGCTTPTPVPTAVPTPVRTAEPTPEPTPEPTETPTPTPTPTSTPTPTAGGNPPRITRIVFPNAIQAGQDNPGTVDYADEDVDVVRADFTQVAGGFDGFSLTITQSEPNDSFGFSAHCPGYGSVTVGVILTDAKGLQSARSDFSFFCNAVIL